MASSNPACQGYKMLQIMKDIINHQNLSILLKPRTRSAEAIWALTNSVSASSVSAYHKSFFIVLMRPIQGMLSQLLCRKTKADSSQRFLGHIRQQKQGLSPPKISTTTGSLANPRLVMVNCAQRQTRRDG